MRCPDPGLIGLRPVQLAAAVLRVLFGVDEGNRLAVRCQAGTGFRPAVEWLLRGPAPVVPRPPESLVVAIAAPHHVHEAEAAGERRAVRGPALEPVVRAVEPAVRGVELG